VNWGPSFAPEATAPHNGPDSSTNYDNQANYLLAENSRASCSGRTAPGNNNVPPFNRLLVANSLIAANKDFDFFLFPNRRFGNEPYTTRRRWDHFVRHLMGVEPPLNSSSEHGQPEVMQHA